MGVFVTGANGFLGSHICRELLNEGYQVKALVREGSNLTRIDDILGKLEIIKADLLDLPTLDTLLSGIDYVVHCAARVSFDAADCSDMLENNVESTRNIVNLCLKYGVKQLVHISSIAAIGRTRKEETLDESTKWNESEYTTCYGKSKYLSEMEVWRGESEGLNTTVLNPSLIIGRNTLGEGTGQIFQYVRDGRRHYPPGNANLVDVRDVASAVIISLKNNVIGQRIILNSVSLPYQALFEQIAEKLNTKAPDISTTGWKLNLALWLDKLRAAVSNQPRYLTREIVRNSTSRVTFINRRAKEVLGLNFHSLEDSLNWIIQEP
jgi:nucleoside-diphosphate-sugar epimerase